MIVKPPFKKTLLSLLVSGVAFGMSEARAAQCETTTDSEGNVTTTSGVCDGYGNNNDPLDGSFTNISSIEIPSTETAGVSFIDSYVDSIFNSGSITGNGIDDYGIFINNSSFLLVDNQADITNTNIGINIDQNQVNSGSIINRANIGSYGNAITLNIANNAEAGNITNEGTINTVGDVPDFVDVTSAIGVSVQNTDNSIFSGIINKGEINTNDSGVFLETSDNSTSGDVTNSGAIVSENGKGIYITTFDNAESGDIINDTAATINALNSGIHMSVDDYSTAGKITNSGNISGLTNGIEVDITNHSTGGSIVNAASGVINISTEEEEVEESGRAGITVSVATNSSVGDITNEGTISAPEYGIRLSAENQGNIGQVSNNGSVTSTEYQGINVTLDEQSTLAGVQNSGEITSTFRSIDVRAENGSNSGDIINTGTIISTKNENGPGPSGPFGDYGSENIYVTGYNATFNDVINTGTLTALGDDAIEVNLYDGSAMGDVINTGTITAYFDGLDVDVEDNSTVGRVINTGNITASNDGIEVDVEEGSSVQWVENAGTIEGIASEGGIADGMSIDVEDGSSIGTVINTGTINVINNDIMEFDIDYGSTIDNIINEGTLSFNPEGIQFSSYFAGIEVEADNQGDDETVNHIGQVVNNGAITASGRGIDIELEEGSVLDQVINTGTITASHSGIEIDTRDNDVVTDMSITNSGSVVSNYYDGLTIYGDLNSTVTNTGSIAGQLHGVSLYTDRYDIHNDSEHSLTVNLNNSGTITGKAGNGIYIATDVDGNINNTGTITSQSSGDMFADYGVNTNTGDYTHVGDYSRSNGGIMENMSLSHLEGTNWYVLEKTLEGSNQTLHRFFQSNGGVDKVASFIETGNYDYDNEETFRPYDEYTLVFDQVYDGDSNTLTEYVSQPVEVYSVRDSGSYETAMPRYINASAIKITGSLNGDIINAGNLVSGTGSTVDVSGSHNGKLYNTGTITGGTLTSLPDGNVQWPEDNSVDAPFEIDYRYSSMLDEGYFPGMSLPESSGSGPQAGDKVAIDFSGAQTALDMIQFGDTATINGDIWGKIANEDNKKDTITFGDDKTNTGGGSFTGNIYGVEDIQVIGSNFTLNGNSYEQGGFNNTFTVASSGILNIGTNTGTRIDGQYIQAGGLVVPVGEINSALNSDASVPVLDIGDNADISGTMTVNPDWSEFNYSRTSQEKYHVVNSGTMNYSGTLTNQTVLFTQNINEEGDTDLYLAMSSNDLETEVENASGNTLYGDLADDLQTALVTQGSESELFQSLLSVADGEALSEIIENAVTGKDGSEALLAEALQDGVFNNILARLAETRSGQGGVSFGEEQSLHGGVWLKALMVKANQSRQTSGSETFNGYDAKTKGFTLGYDLDLNNQWTVGMAWSYADSNMEIKNSSDETTTKSYQLSLYGNWQSGDWFVDSIVNLGLNKNDSSRVTGSDINYKADFDSRQYGVRIVAGKEFWFNDKDTLLEPQLIFNYSQLSTDKYKETASGQSDITVKSSDYEVMELGAGVRFTHMFELENSILLPEASLKGYYDFKGDTMSQEVNVNILDTSLDYRTTGLETQRMTWQAGVGVSWWLDNNITLSMNYDRTWRSGFNADSIQAKIRYDF